ncbi:hypothetical protein GQ42DRAFT_163229 [Ramicandelaber brevisporus]|nr:hypothetical protein GQ42DRAFT_163229 [Ramicandelaber brevisporus]
MVRNRKHHDSDDSDPEGFVGIGGDNAAGRQSYSPGRRNGNKSVHPVVYLLVVLLSAFIGRQVYSFICSCPPSPAASPSPPPAAAAIIEHDVPAPPPVVQEHGQEPQLPSPPTPQIAYGKHRIPQLGPVLPQNIHYLGFDAVYVINLPRRKDRRSSMEDMLAFLNVEATFIDAFEGSEVESSKPSTAHELRPAQYAVLRSHLKAWEDAYRKQDKIKTFLVLEDDVDMELDIQYLVRRVLKRIEKVGDGSWDTIHFGHCGSEAQQDTLVDFDLKLFRATHPQCAHAYAVNMSAIPKMLPPLRDTPHSPLDLEFVWLIKQGKIKSYAVDPSFMRQVRTMEDAGDVTRNPKKAVESYKPLPQLMQSTRARMYLYPRDSRIHPEVLYAFEHQEI